MPTQASSTRAGDRARVPSPLLKLLFRGRITNLYERSRRGRHEFILDNLLAEMRIDLRIAEQDLVRVPRSGAAVVVANHPFGILDGAALLTTMRRIRPDTKVLVNDLLSVIPELAPHCIFLDPFGSKSAVAANSSALKQALQHLRAGGLLIIFPAGEVSHFDIKERRVLDSVWSDTAARLVRHTGATTVPIFITGRNSVPFHLLGMVYPLLRTTQLANELVNKEGKQIEIRIGCAIDAEKLRACGTDAEATRLLRWKTYLLAQRGVCRRRESAAKRFMRRRRASMSATVADAVPQSALIGEIAQLQRSLIEQNREFEVYAARGREIPSLLREIGRLREVTFRAVGEGTGKALDIDHFDSYYTHLILWSRTKHEIVGAYRMANTAEVIRERGESGLYTSTLFRYQSGFFDAIGPALELGRSFIRCEYQKQYAPLLMLWKAISRYVALHPETPVLFGAVSISSEYTRASREMLVRYFGDSADPELSRMVTPRTPMRLRSMRRWETDLIRRVLQPEEISASIADVEHDGKGMPILLKQYLKLGGKLLAFNVDADFADALDGLIMVDLRKTDPSRLEPYMGRAGVASFRAYHRFQTVSS